MTPAVDLAEMDEVFLRFDDEVFVNGTMEVLAMQDTNQDGPGSGDSVLDTVFAYSTGTLVGGGPRRPAAGQRRLTIWLCVMLLNGCSGRPGRVAPPNLDPTGAAEKALADFDTNGDGGIDASELGGCPGLKAVAKAVDTDRDGRLSASEIAARIAQWGAQRVAMVAVNCSVVRSGRPLQGATVTFVPEKFLGPNIKPASGVSDNTGRVELAVSGVPLKGLAHCGFFRVEISKKEGDKELIPAKFNRETVLGEEINEGDNQRKVGFVFDVSGG